MTESSVIRASPPPRGNGPHAGPYVFEEGLVMAVRGAGAVIGELPVRPTPATAVATVAATV
ncbi:MAG: hypothetical protein HUU22_08045, partial [Phycisphaerae bacterium]|nr:hypothetical protein [Phycisphaerae bacterium]